MLESPEASGSSVEDARELHERTLRELRVLGDPYYLTWEMAMYGDFLVRHGFVEEGKALASVRA